MTAKLRLPVVAAASFLLLVTACSSQEEAFSETTTDQVVSSTTTDQREATETTTADRQESAIAWSRVTRDERVFGGNDDQRMRSVAASDSGFVAVGWDRSGGDTDAAVWTSSDGVAWSRVPHDEAVFGGNDTQTMRSVTASDWGLVAVGNDNSGGDFDAAVWTSPDGVAWSRVPLDEAVFGGDGDKQMESVTAVASGLVAVGLEKIDDDTDAAVWTSPDGVVWSRVPHDEAVFGGESYQDMNSVVGTEEGFVAVGEDRSSGYSDAAVWTSPDGVVWSRVPPDEAVFGGDDVQKTMSVTAWESGFVAVGMDFSGGDFDAAVWTSPDGVVWSRVPHDEAVFGGDANQQMLSIASAESGIVAVGDEESGGDFDAAVWVATRED